MRRPDKRRYGFNNPIHRGSTSGRFSARIISNSQAIILAFILFIAQSFFACAKNSRSIADSQLPQDISQSIDSFSTTLIEINIDKISYQVNDSTDIYKIPRFSLGKRVFVCTGDYAECYHSKINCPGLQKCGIEIVSFKSDSIPQNLRQCELCYKSRKSNTVMPPLRNPLEEPIL